MKSAPVAYCHPESLDEALRLLSEHGPDAKVLSGGQSLLPLMSMRLARPSVLVDVSRLEELGGKTTARDGGITLGAGMVHSAIEDDRGEAYAGHLLSSVASGIGYRAIRNRGTLGGSLAHADASAEWPVTMAALDATIVAASTRGWSRYRAAGFGRGFLMTALVEDEVIVAVELPAALRSARSGYYKSARKPGEFSDSLAVALLSESTSGGTIAAASIWLGAAAEVPVELTALEASLVGGRLGDAMTSEVIAAVEEELGAVTTADERYRRHLHAVSVSRAIEKATAL